MKLYEIFDRDPRTARLANNGQARITGQLSDRTTKELRAELETFVSNGQFGRALQVILDSYLRNLDHNKQDAAWVSGFFGSGKSHLIKILGHLWANTEFIDGSTARSLVGGSLPGDVEANLRELDIQARRTGLPAVAAAGTLLSGTDRVRETVLAIILQEKDWPTQYPQAKFCFWLRDQGWLELVRSAVEKAGKNWLQELNNLYVSPHIRRALLEADPSLAQDEKEVSHVLRNQFPQLTTDITTAQFIETAKEALQDNGELPLTLIVLDEVQQYINEATDRAATITEVAEALQTQFDSRVMLVGAGQSALSAGTPALMWLRDRFKISVELADADVEAVTRKVLLQKKPSAEPAITELLENNSGEVARHLRGTKIGERAEDRRDRVADYPLLPTRRRFWEACFQAVDKAGTHSQLRSQLRILHDAIQEIAEHDLGTVLPSSELFLAIAPSLVQTGVLLNEINTRIQKLDDGTEQGRVRRDLCGLVFLVGKLPREVGVDFGVRADAQTLADLLLGDITRDSGPFRNEIAKELEALAEDGTLMKVGEEYRLQTTEGAEWDRAYREKQASLRQNEVEITTRRDHLFSAAVQQVVSDIKLSHGDAKIRRSLALHSGNEPPREGGEHVTVWLRDGWSTSEKNVHGDAHRLGQDDPTLHVYLPKRNADDLKGRIIDSEAARQVIDSHGIPSTPEGIEAREGMESRLRVAENARDEIIRDVIRAAKAFQGGDHELHEDTLREKIDAGAAASLARLFPQFNKGDHKAWEVALKRAKDGSDEPFKVVGWDEATADHPVAKAVLVEVGAGARGRDVQKNLKSSPYGWPQDAVDAALIALHRSGHLRATKNGQPIAASALDQAGVKGAEFKPEKVRLAITQRITLRGLFEKVGVKTKPGDEEVRAQDFLGEMSALASRAGGEAPLPPVPDTPLLDDLGQLTGSEQLGAILDNKDPLEKMITAWTALVLATETRSPAWGMAMSFHQGAEGLPIHGELVLELTAISEQRSLLSEPDHITPLVSKLAKALREALTDLHASLSDAVSLAETHLNSDATWSKLNAGEQNEIRGHVGLVPPGPLTIANDKQLRTSLESRSLPAWRAEVDAVPSRIDRALNEAAQRVKKQDPGIETTTVSVRKGTLSSETEVENWLEEHGKKLKQAVVKGPVIVK